MNRPNPAVRRLAFASGAVAIALCCSAAPAHARQAQDTRPSHTAGEVREIEVVAENMKFTPDRIVVEPGQRLRIKLVNRGEAEHNIEFELPSGERELERNVPEGETGVLEFTAPDEPGEYTAYCPVGDHREHGMTATLVVKEGRSPQQPGDGVTTVEGEWKGPESILHDEQADVYLVSNINGGTTAKDGNGFISRVSPDGQVRDLRWIDGESEGVTLHAPKGMAIHDGTLYVADIDAVRLFDCSTGKPKGEWPAPGASFLNDLAVTDAGVIYATDTAIRLSDTGAESSGEPKIYRFSADGKATVVASGAELNGPNGIIAADGDIFFVTFGGRDVMWLDETSGEVERVAELPEGRLDGIVQVDDNVLLVSTWDGKAIYGIEGPAGDREVTEAVVRDVTTPADFGFDRRRNCILLPLLEEDEVRIIPLR